MSDRTTLSEKTAGFAQDSSGRLTPSDIDSCLDAAISRYSRHRPDEKTVDISGSGEHDYDLPQGWLEGFSDIRQIEYPVDQVPAMLLDDDDYELYRSVDGLKLRLISYAPADDFRVTITVPRTDETVPGNDIDAVSLLAASLCLERLATRFVDTGDPIIQADVVNYRTKSAEAAARAKQYAKLYKEHLGLKEDDNQPAASAVSSNEINYPGGGDRLTHPRRGRRLR